MATKNNIHEQIYKNLRRYVANKRLLNKYSQQEIIQIDNAFKEIRNGHTNVDGYRTPFRRDKYHDGEHFEIIIRDNLQENELIPFDELKRIEQIFIDNNLDVELFQKITKEDNISFYCDDAELVGQDVSLHVLIKIISSV